MIRNRKSASNDKQIQTFEINMKIAWLQSFYTNTILFRINFYILCTSSYCSRELERSRLLYSFCIFSRRSLFTHVGQLKKNSSRYRYLDFSRRNSITRKDKFLEVSEITLYRHRKVVLLIHNRVRETKRVRPGMLKTFLEIMKRHEKSLQQTSRNVKNLYASKRKVILALYKNRYAT